MNLQPFEMGKYKYIVDKMCCSNQVRALGLIDNTAPFLPHFCTRKTNSRFEGGVFLFLVQPCVVTPVFAKILPLPKLALSSKVLTLVFV